jgi:mycothiol synthase
MVDAPAPGYTLRPPSPADLESVAAFLVTVTVAEFGEPDYSLDDLRDEWADLDLPRDAFLVVAADGTIAGYASVSHRGHVRLDADCYVHPEHEGRGIGTLLVRATETRARDHIPLAPPSARVWLNNGINGLNQRARDLLAGEGYTPARHFWRMEIPLDPPPPPPTWPPAIAVRPRLGDGDDPLFHATLEEAFRDHWGYVPRSFDAWAHDNKGERFDPTLWFLALAGDEPVAALLGSSYLEMGWIDSLGVRPAWRHRGLGQALLRHAFAEFQRRGWHRAGLHVDAANETGATRLYEAAGMRPAHQYAIYQKELRPGEELSPAS